jgi:small-conductance mechanosensitive channel
MNDQIQNIAAWKSKLIEYIISHSGALVSAVIVAGVGFVVARWLGKLLDRWLERKAMEPPLRTLLVRLTRLLILALALVVALGTAGMDVTALIAGVGIAMLADSAINIAIGPWTAVTDCGQAQAELYQAVVEQFNAGHIQMPFPQREVRLLPQG